MPTRHRQNFTEKGEVKKCPKELHAKLRSPHCRVEQSEFQPQNRPKPSPGPSPGPGPVPPFVPGYNPGDRPTPVEPVGPFNPPPIPPPPAGGSGFPYGPVIAGSVVGGIGAGLLARRALQSSMRAVIDPSPDQPPGSIEYQDPEAETGEGDIDTVGDDPIEDPTEPLEPTTATTTTTTSTTEAGEGAGEAGEAGEGAGEAGEGAAEIGGGTTDVLGAGADIGSEASSAMTTTSLDAGFFTSAAEASVPAAEESTLLAVTGAAAEATADTAGIATAAEAVTATATAGDIAVAEAAAAPLDVETLGISAGVAAATGAAIGAAAAGGIILAYESAHPREPSITQLTSQQLSSTLGKLINSSIRTPAITKTINSLANAFAVGSPVYNVYNGTTTSVVAQLSNKDLIKAQASYNSNPNVFKGQDVNVLTAMGLNPNLSKGSITGNFYNSNVANPPPATPPSTPAPTTGGDTNQKPATATATRRVGLYYTPEARAARATEIARERATAATARATAQARAAAAARATAHPGDVAAGGVAAGARAQARARARERATAATARAAAQARARVTAHPGDVAAGGVAAGARAAATARATAQARTARTASTTGGIIG